MQKVFKGLAISNVSIRKACALSLLMTAAVAGAQTPPPPLDGIQSDPAKMGWMVGAPPAADKLVKQADMTLYAFPRTRWSFSNFRSLVPSSNIWRGNKGVSVLAQNLRSDIDALTFTPLGADKPMTWEQSLTANYTDAIMVLHKGKVVYERYFGVTQPQTTHMAMSVTKSFFGILGAMLIQEGKLDPNAKIPQYIAELKGTAYEDATVQQVLDMRIGVKYSEAYADPNAEIWQHMRAGGVFPRPADYKGPQSFYQFLKTLQKEGNHGEGFYYKTVNTDVVGWLIRRATGQSVGQVLSERIWQKIGAEENGDMLIDTEGTEFAGGGLNITLRDMARFGETMRLKGKFNGQQIIPSAVIETIEKGGDKEAFAKGGFATLPGGSYKNMWWVFHNEHGAYAARGVHGQTIYIDPKAQMVIVRFASAPIASNARLDPTSLPAYHALAKHLMHAK